MMQLIMSSEKFRVGSRTNAINFARAIIALGLASVAGYFVFIAKAKLAKESSVGES